jgi:hypothetical protein
MLICLKKYEFEPNIKYYIIVRFCKSFIQTPGFYENINYFNFLRIKSLFYHL